VFGSWRGGGVVSAGSVAFSPSGYSDQSLVGLWFGLSAACAAPAPTSTQTAKTAAVDRQAKIRRARSRREGSDAAVALLSTPNPDVLKTTLAHLLTNDQAAHRAGRPGEIRRDGLESGCELAVDRAAGPRGSGSGSCRVAAAAGSRRRRRPPEARACPAEGQAAGRIHGGPGLRRERSARPRQPAYDRREGVRPSLTLGRRASRPAKPACGTASRR
jgi:hypothetical protein